jgi:hypothetical protein
MYPTRFSLQTFSIPGSIFLSFVGGSLFGLPGGILLVSTVKIVFDGNQADIFSYRPLGQPTAFSFRR